MNLTQITNELELSFTSKSKFKIEVDHVSDEFHSISFNSLEKDQESFTVLILPQLKIPHQLNLIKLKDKLKELFGNDSKGGEK